MYRLVATATVACALLMSMRLTADDTPQEAPAEVTTTAEVKDAETVVDILKKPANPMRGKPFIERLLPGTSLQFQSSTVIYGHGSLRH